MNELPRQKLLEIFAKHGRSVIENPRRLEGLLRDYAGAHRREISVLVAAVEERAVLDLLAGAASVPPAVLLSRLARRLCEDLGLTPEAARWSIESWALALGVIDDSAIARVESAAESNGNAARNKTISPHANAASPAARAAAAGAQPERATSSLIVARDGSGQFESVAEALRNATPNMLITVREGLYEESVVLDKNVQLAGEGDPQKIIVRGVDASPLVVRTDRASVRGITLQARGARSGKAFFAIEIPRGAFVLENCRVTSDSLSGIAVFGADAAPSIKNCRIYDCLDSGIYVFDNARPRVEGCDVHGNGNVNVAIAAGANPSIENCRIYEGGNGGVVVWGRAAGTIENCQIYGHRLANVGVRDDADPVFRNCEIYDGRDTGIYVHQNGYGTFEDCRIHGNAKAEVGAAQNAASILRRCTIRDGENSGVIVQNRGRLLIESCDVHDNADAGVAVLGESEAVLRGCRIRRNGTVAVRLLEASSALVEDCDLRGSRIATWETEHGINIERRNNVED